ncbi:prolyl oligopeptidase family serine peptidase [Streptomyces sp. NBC_00289]|uniref:S9 family peptidase n=1 Tax=Streptomyces sp. NBC_00289 TaxID=2975703 RepID=UPI00352C92B1
MAADARNQVTGEPTARAPRSKTPRREPTARAPHGEAPAQPAVVAHPGAAGPAQETRMDGRQPAARPADVSDATCSAAPSLLHLPEAAGARDAVTRLHAHGCWYPSANPDGTQVAFICDRSGVPQLWAGPVDGDEVRLLDSAPDPVTEVSWSPDGRWIAYTTAPGGGEHSRVLCVRPDGTGRRALAGADPDSTAYLGCWAHDGSAVAVTVAPPAARTSRVGAGHAPADPGPAGGHGYGTRPPADWADRDGHPTLLGEAPYDARLRPALTRTQTQAELLTGAWTRPWSEPEPTPEQESWRRPGVTPAEATAALTAAQAGSDGGLSAYLIDPDGLVSPALLATETHAATLRVCDLSRDGGLALLRRGPRGRREAVVRRTADSATTCTVPVADGDPWIGRFSSDARTLWLRSNADREYAALFAVALGADGGPHGVSVVSEREGSDLELLTLAQDGRTAALAWNAQGASELELVETFPKTRRTPDDTGPARPVPLPHEVVTRVVAAGPGRLLLALSGSQRRPGVWWAHEGVSLLRTPWSSRDQDAVPPGRPPVRPVPLRLGARDGLPLSGWYYRAPGRAADEPAPCVIHLHGGPEEQERPVFNPLYHELLGRGLDVFAPDVRGSSGHGRSFVDADLGAGRFAALDDVADCAAHVVAAGLADPTRLAVMGRSYGGYLVFASLVWHPDLFRTGVAVCGMSDFLTFFAGTEPWIAESAAHKYGHPEHDRELLHALSPMSRIDALRVPLLAVHGEHDTNVPPGESEQFVRAARERGLPAELLTLRDEGHDFLRADNRRRFRRAAADWMQRQLRL